MPALSGERIGVQGGTLSVPDRPIIPFIEGDGTGPDIWRASQMVFDAAVQKAYGGKKKVAWAEVLAGEKAYRAVNNWLPLETVDAFRTYLVGIKGPLTTRSAAEFARSTSLSASSWICMSACDPCGTSGEFLPRFGLPRRWTW